MNILKFSLLFFFVSKLYFAQEKKSVYVLEDSLSVDFSLKDIHNKEALKTFLHQKGYYFYKTKRIKKDSLEAYFIELNRKISTIIIKKLTDENIKILQKNKESIYLKPENLHQWMENISLEFDQEGQSFTELKLQNHIYKNDTLWCDLKLNQSKSRYTNKIVNKGYKKFPKRFIKHYIKTNKPFSKQTLVKTEAKINQLSFAKNIRKPAVLFTRDSTHLYLYTKKIKANRLDALFGFSNQEGKEKIKFNGYIDISLTNTLHKGETFAFKWNNSGEDQQEIILHVDNPYIFNSPINFTYNLNTFRQDTSFVNTKQSLYLGYVPHYKHIVKTYYTNEKSITLEETATKNEEYAKNILGFTYTYQIINRWKTPKIKLELDYSYGNRNSAITTKQQTFRSDFIYDFEIYPNNHIYTRNRNSYLASKNKSPNELYRIGGATTMRGFLEQSITGHLYNYINLEYRYYNNPISYLYIFSDIGYFKNLDLENNLLSFGLGYTLGVKTGILKISYAVGKNQDTSFNLNNGLFHVNFVTVF